MSRPLLLGTKYGFSTLLDFKDSVFIKSYNYFPIQYELLAIIVEKLYNYIFEHPTIKLNILGYS